jgi:hypothetical protein
MANIPKDPRAEEAQQLYRRYLDARKDWDTYAREDMDFYLGNHFNETEADELQERNQSNLTIDRMYSAIEQMKAQITAKPPHFTAIAREDSDTKLSVVWQTILDYVWDISDGNETFKQVIHDYAITGLGYFYAYIDREADYGRGEVKFSYVDPFRVVVDPNARNKYFDDASNIILSTIMSREQLINYYPEIQNPIDEEGNALIDMLETNNTTDDETYPNAQNRSYIGAFTPDVTKDYDYQGSNKYLLLEKFTKVKVPFFRILDKTTGQEKIVDQQQMELLLADPRIQQMIENEMFDYVQVLQNRIKLCCSVGQIVLFETILNTDMYPIVPVPNIWTNTPYPMSDVRKCRDMQRYINKMMSLLMSHAQSSAGLKLLIPTGSVQDIEQLERDWANPNATIEYDPSYGEPHFPAPQPLSSSIYSLMQQAERYIDLNMGIFELSQGNPDAAPRTASATMQIEDFGARRVKSKLRDVEGSLKRVGMVIYNLAKSHYTFQKTFSVVQPNNDLNEFTVNRLYDDKTSGIQAMKNDISIGQYDIKVIGNSTLPSNRYGELSVYMDAYRMGLIDRTEALKKTEIFDKQGVLERTSEISQLQSQLEQAQKVIKDLSGDLQTARRETVHTRQQIEVEKAKTRIADSEMRSKSASRDALGKLSNAVKLQQERIRMETKNSVNSQEKLQEE